MDFNHKNLNLVLGNLAISMLGAEITVKTIDSDGAFRLEIRYNDNYQHVGKHAYTTQSRLGTGCAGGVTFYASTYWQPYRDMWGEPTQWYRNAIVSCSYKVFQYDINQPLMINSFSYMQSSGGTNVLVDTIGLTGMQVHSRFEGELDELRGGPYTGRGALMIAYRQVRFMRSWVALRVLKACGYGRGNFITGGRV